MGTLLFMPISDIPILAMLRERMQWHEARQQVLAENVANADTPNYQAKDLAPPTFEGALWRARGKASRALAREVDGGGADDEALAVLVLEPDIHLGSVVVLLLVRHVAVQRQRMVRNHRLAIGRAHPR